MKIFILIVFIMLTTISCMSRSNNIEDCEPGYKGENCSECAENYVKVSKYCIYDCNTVANSEKVNGSNDGCICKSGYEFDLENRLCNKIECTADRDCKLGSICVNDVCKEGCRADRDCEYDEICNYDTGECVTKPCELSSDCKDNKICLNNECIAGCDINQDCENNEICDVNTHKCINNNTGDCRIENNCEDGYKCNEATGECKEIDCRTDNYCKQGFECDIFSGRCIVKSTCITQSDCPEGYKCENSQCLAKIRCYTDEECTGREICRADGYCDIDRGCDSDQYCVNKNSDRHACNISSGLCYECVTNEHCSNPDKPFCNTITYTCGAEEEPADECQADSDCGMNKRCNTEVSPHECIDMISNCQTDNDCQNNMYCNTSNGRCVMCLNDSHCSEPQICNPGTNICEEEGSGGDDNNGLCAEQRGAVTCTLMGGTCDEDGNCNISDDPCHDVSCPANSTCDNGSCECNAGYHENGSLCVENETCTVVTCPADSHCELNNYEAGCYCDDGYIATDTDNDGLNDTCVEDNNGNKR